MPEKFTADFRQGYLQGYQAAFDNLVALLRREDYDLEKAKDTGRDFWVNQLSDWLANDGDLPVLNISQELDEEVTITTNPLFTQTDPYDEKTLEAG